MVSDALRGGWVIVEWNGSLWSGAGHSGVERVIGGAERVIGGAEPVLELTPVQAVQARPLGSWLSCIV